MYTDYALKYTRLATWAVMAKQGSLGGVLGGVRQLQAVVEVLVVQLCCITM